MGKIDDPFDQIEFVYREQSGQNLSLSLNVAAPILALLSGPAGALASVVGLVRQFLGDQRQQARAQAMQNGLREGFGDAERRLDNLEKKLTGPDAEEAVVVAIQRSLRSARYDKARRFGQVIGATLAQDAPNWAEAAEFIRNLEEFTDDDLTALKHLWVIQRRAYGGVKGQSLEMSTDANAYTSQWNDVLALAEKSGTSKDDWYARCARLSGFGLTLLVQPNSSYQGPDALCFRLTGRAVRLMKLLGRNVDPAAYPALRYHSTKPEVTVNDEDQDRALGDGWADTPAAFGRKT